jgi:putative Mn2+ efflux pump MntP
MNQPMLLTLVAAAMTVAALHSLAPDHWAPFAALSRARGWSAGRTARVTFFCGLGHVTVSAVLGLIAISIGLQLIEALGAKMESIAGILLITFGLVYAFWGLRTKAGRRLHGHSHTHFDHIHDSEKTTAWSLFALFSVDPCVALLPILVAAAPLGWVAVATVVVAYELATITSMISLVLLARAGVTRLRFHWLDHWGHAAAGAFIVLVGIVVGLLGI